MTKTFLGDLKFGDCFWFRRLGNAPAMFVKLNNGQNRCEIWDVTPYYKVGETYAFGEFTEVQHDTSRVSPERLEEFANKNIKNLVLLITEGSKAHLKEPLSIVKEGKGNGVTVNIPNWGICVSPVIINGKRIGGVHQRTGWLVEGSTVQHNYPDSPDDVGTFPLGEVENTFAAAQLVIESVFKMSLKHWFDCCEEVSDLINTTD